MQLLYISFFIVWWLLVIYGNLSPSIATTHVTENHQLSLKCSCHFVTVSRWRWEQGFRLSGTEVCGVFFFSWPVALPNCYANVIILH